MRIYNTVKTTEKAIEILNKWLSDGKDEKQFSRNTTIKPTSAPVNCECGQTNAMEVFHEGENVVATIAICDCCGDDDAFYLDVLNFS